MKERVKPSKSGLRLGLIGSLTSGTGGRAHMEADRSTRRSDPKGPKHEIIALTAWVEAQTVEKGMNDARALRSHDLLLQEHVF
ncbi:unnamed protein product [Caenorhabditis auriculariae]|uniref:Uncharacterized protein n=1 Tax=Caenorhabditis auriculariae TaxID=2777116 RepID=A0A8S1H5Y2_9PELO|nr:unnamed protein product [Caenorhabditis auriculariae]